MQQTDADRTEALSILHVRLPTTEMEEIRRAARRQRRSISSFVRAVLAIAATDVPLSREDLIRGTVHETVRLMIGETT
jgi:hypothetical protein